VCIGAEVKATVLVDGLVAGTWRVRRTRGEVTGLEVTPFRPLPTTAREAVEAEAAELLAFLAPGAGPDGVSIDPGAAG
jgi:hypothetical protein